MSQENRKAEKEWSLVQNLYVNDLEFVTAVFGIELIPVVKRLRFDGRLYPAMRTKRRRWLPIPPDKVSEMAEQALERKRDWMRMLGHKDEQLMSLSMPTIPVSEVMAAWVDSRAFWKRYSSLEAKYEAYLAPVIHFHPGGAHPTYEVRPKPNAGQKPIPRD